VCFYRKNLKHLWGFSVIYAAYQGLWIVEGAMVNDFLGNALMITVIVYGPRFLLAIIIQIDSVMKDNIISLERAHKKTKGKYWKTLGCLLLIILFGEVPRYLLFTLNNPFVDIVAVLYFASIGMLFYMLIPVIALSIETTGYMKRTLEMIKGNYLRIFLLYVLTTTFLSYIHLITEGFFFNTSVQSTINIFYIIAIIFVFPFSQVVAVVVYKYLAGKSETNQQHNSVSLIE